MCCRDDFEEKIASLLLRLEATLKALLEKSGNVMIMHHNKLET